MGQEAKKRTQMKNSSLNLQTLFTLRWKLEAYYYNYASKYVSALFSASLNLGFTHVHWRLRMWKKDWIIAGIIYSDFTED